ncbi:hypothetical protein WG922_05615 [Ramlibacter sp. AN1015]|uniref:hypothetical protein n=1 Tax=Ramlibacter sp. AN1015 TaxID=3133428 RepID=UPI0030C24102
MRNNRILVPIISATLFTASAATLAQGAAGSPQGGSAASSAAASSDNAAPSMEKLRQAAQNLRESIQAMAQKQAGPDRDRAIDQAHEALLETQSAMIALPPDMRGSGAIPEIDRTPPSQRRGSAAASDTEYQASVRQLMQAADNLRQSIQAMAQQPAGERRNRAMEQARQALWDSQQAMVAAYDPSSARASRMMGAQGSGGSGQGAARAGSGASDGSMASAQRMRPDRN